MSKKDILGWLLIAAVSAIVGTGGAAIYALKGERSQIDPATSCKTSAPLDDATIVIIDKTDPFSVPQQAVIRDRLLRLKQDLPQFSRLSIHVLWNDKERQSGSRQLMFSLCNPGQGKDANRLYENPSIVQANYNKTFERQFDGILAGLLQPGTAAYSPLAETFFAAIEAEEQVKMANKKHVIFITDLLEYTKDANFYDPKLVDWRKLEKLVPAGSQIWLKDTSVDVLVVTRDKKFELQNTALKAAWLAFFQSIGVAPAFEFF